MVKAGEFSVIDFPQIEYNYFSFSLISLLTPPLGFVTSAMRSLAWPEMFPMYSLGFMEPA